MILEDPTDEELSEAASHDGPVVIVLRNRESVNTESLKRHRMDIYVIKNPSEDYLKLLKAQLMGRRTRPSEVAVEGPISRRELLRGAVIRTKLVNAPTVMENACRARFGCHECVSACPVGALSIVNNRVEVNASTCIECGLCVSVCPTGALAMVGADDNEHVLLLNKFNEVDGIRKITYTCPLNNRAPTDGEYLYYVPCIASVSPEWITEDLTKVSEINLECPDPNCKLSGMKYVEGLINDLSRAIKLRINSDGNRYAIFSDGSVINKSVNYVGIRRSDYAKSLSILKPLMTGLGGAALKIFNVAVDTIKCSFCGVCFAKCPERAFDVGGVGG